MHTIKWEEGEVQKILIIHHLSNAYEFSTVICVDDMALSIPTKQNKTMQTGF